MVINLLIKIFKKTLKNWVNFSQNKNFMFPSIINEYKLYHSNTGSLKYLIESGAISRQLFFTELNTDYPDWLKTHTGSYQDYLNEKYTVYSGYQSYKYEQEWLYEGLIYSASPKSVKYYLEKIKWVSVEIMQYVLVEVPRTLYSGLIADIQHKLQVLGWYIIDNDYEPDSLNRLILIDAKYNESEKTPEIIDDYDDTVYHITTEWRADKILKIGLVPKHKDKKNYHPERIYAYLTGNPMTCATLAVQLYPTLEPEDIVLLKIDLSKNKPTHPRFYTDDFTKSAGVYTMENISPDCISISEVNR